MKKIWRQQSQEEISARVFQALQENISYKHVLGIPASYLDNKVFNQDASFLKEAPFMSALTQNPNHIGCHTRGSSEPFFGGTHQLEKELLDICAVEILKADIDTYDGYVASGGTEANLQAVWIYRNYFQQEFGATNQDILLICSTDSHYSFNKAANLLALDIAKFGVDEDTREIDPASLTQLLRSAQAAGKRHFIVVNNMMTTMFGSVDNVNLLTHTLEDAGVSYKLHVDGAYGGFYYPFLTEAPDLTFANPHISSFTLDAHKMAQAPYGTGIFLARKGLIEYTNTKEASYVAGEDYTLIGSRSGANAIAVWMILSKNGPHGWFEKIYLLQKRTEWLTQQLTNLGIVHYRHPLSNIVTIRSEYLDAELIHKYWLVPDNHLNPQWHKIVIMEHVTVDILDLFVEDLKAKKQVGIA